MGCSVSTTTDGGCDGDGGGGGREGKGGGRGSQHKPAGTHLCKIHTRAEGYKHVWMVSVRVLKRRLERWGGLEADGDLWRRMDLVLCRVRVSLCALLCSLSSLNIFSR